MDVPYDDQRVMPTPTVRRMVHQVLDGNVPHVEESEEYIFNTCRTNILYKALCIACGELDAKEVCAEAKMEV